MQHFLTSLLAQFMPISDLTSRWIAHFLPVIQCSASAIWSELKTSNYFIFSDTIPVEQHQLEWNSIEILSCAFCGWNVKCKAFVENGTERSLLHVSLLLRNSLSLEWEKSWNGKTWIFFFSLSLERHSDVSWYRRDIFIRSRMLNPTAHNSTFDFVIFSSSLDLHCREDKSSRRDQLILSPVKRYWKIFFSILSIEIWRKKIFHLHPFWGGFVLLAKQLSVDPLLVASRVRREARLDLAI